MNMGKDFLIHKKFVILFTYIMISTFPLVACAPHSQQQTQKNADVIKAKLSPATISQIVRGVTSRNEVITLLGSPNIITQSSDGNEVWHYSRMQIERYEDTSSSGTGVLPSLVVAAKQSQAFAITSSKSFDLAVTFDPEGKVQDFKSVTTQF